MQIIVWFIVFIFILTFPILLFLFIPIFIIWNVMNSYTIDEDKKNNQGRNFFSDQALKKKKEKKEKKEKEKKERETISKNEEYLKLMPREVTNLINKEINTIRNAYRKSIKVDSFERKNYEKFLDEFEEYLIETSETLKSINKLHGYTSRYTFIVNESYIKLYDSLERDYVRLPHDGYASFDEWIEALNSLGEKKLKQKKGLIFERPIEFIENKFKEIDLGMTYDPDMDPFEYERFCANEFKKNGWDAEATKGSSDQGVDVLASKNDKVLVAQCKKFSKPVGNKAVQEIVAGIKYYNATIGIVIAPNGFTNSASKLAEANKINLIHHSEIKDLE